MTEYLDQRLRTEQEVILTLLLVVFTSIINRQK